MKKLILLISAFLFLNYIAIAQKIPLQSAGLYGGINISGMNMKRIDILDDTGPGNNYDSKSEIGINLGALYKLHLSETFSFSFGIGLHTEKFSLINENDLSETKLKYTYPEIFDQLYRII